MATSSDFASRDLRAEAAHAAAIRAAAAARARERGRRFRRVVGTVIFAAASVAAAGTGYRFQPVSASRRSAPVVEVPSDPKSIQSMETRLQRRRRELLTMLERRRPKGIYIVIDQTQNRLYVMKDDEVLREAVCSAGSGMILEETATDRKWVFDTPRGVFRVMSKLEDPVWKKPDWAFIEEGKPIPRNPSDRFDYGVLGEYALYFGDGYMIHGTLYERLLGRSVTHGCIRLGRDDLREVYAAAPIGTPIYIY